MPCGPLELSKLKFATNSWGGEAAVQTRDAHWLCCRGQLHFICCTGLLMFDCHPSISSGWGFQFLHVLANMLLLMMIRAVMMIIKAILLKWCLIVVLICIFLVMGDVGYFFMCYLIVCISVEKCLIKSFDHCLIELSFGVWVVSALCIFWILDTYQIYGSKTLKKSQKTKNFKLKIMDNRRA